MYEGLTKSTRGQGTSNTKRLSGSFLLCARDDGRTGSPRTGLIAEKIDDRTLNNEAKQQQLEAK